MDKMPEPIKFQAVKEGILKRLNDLNEKKRLGIHENVELIDGFVNQPLTMEISNSLYIGGATIPMIMLFGKDSGKIYFFALRAIIGEFENVDV